MSTQAIIEQYTKHSILQSIKKSIEISNASITLQQVSSSAFSFQLLALYKIQSAVQLIIASNKEEAAYIENDLQSILLNKDQHIILLADSFKQTGKFTELSTYQQQSKVKLASWLSRNTLPIIITYPEAIIEKMSTVDNNQQVQLNIQKDEAIVLDQVVEQLIEMGFEHVDFVHQPGQLSVRGGIIDIFSYGNEWPYRVELFDNEVESIRTFDPISQLSQQTIQRLTIVPGLAQADSTTEWVPLFDNLPENTVVWTINKLNILERVAEILEQIPDTFEHLDQEQFAAVEPANFFASLQQIKEGFSKFALIDNCESSETPPDFKYKLTEQPSFNKDFKQLAQYIQTKEKEGYGVHVFSENEHQFNRLQQIFSDIADQPVVFTAVPNSIHAGFVDKDLKLICLTDHQLFNRYHKYKLKKGFDSSQALLLKTLKELTPGDFVTHIDHGVGRYSGLEKIEVSGQTQEAVRIIYANDDLLYVNINSLHKLSKYAGKEGIAPKISKLGSDTWSKLKNRTKKKIKDIAQDLIKLYAKRKAQKGLAFSPDSVFQTELEASFMYEDTPDQSKATQDVKQDMERAQPMDRLICGDVGFGKTEIAIRAAFKAVSDSKQVAILVPTTILAFQHFQTFKKRLEDFPCTVDYINRFKTSKQRKEVIEKVKEGKIDILIGTHGIVGKTVQFKDLGLLIVDEEQKFGVGIKEKLKQIKANVDTLTLTATPIPRTLQFSLLGARDLSVINTPPPNRQPVNTELLTFNPDRLKEAIEYEVYRGGQVFFVHNKVKDIHDLKDMLLKLVPDLSIGMAHGQLPGDELEDELMQFIDHRYDVLLSTNIVESGIDIPNANTIIINNAHWFGLSDLHQLRGRVGRSNKKAFCYLVSPPLSSLTKEARQRLQTIEQFAELGSGFQVSMRDLDIRGAGNLLGGEQSGFIAEIGYDTYHKILDEAITELKEDEYADLYADEKSTKEPKLFVKECQVDIDEAMLIPDTYVNNINERFNLYNQLNQIKQESELHTYSKQLQDRFGPIPTEVYNLFEALRIKWLALPLGIERITYKQGQVKCYFIADQSSKYYESDIFSHLLQYIQKHPEKLALKQTPKHLLLRVQGIDSLKSLTELMNQINQ